LCHDNTLPLSDFLLVDRQLGLQFIDLILVAANGGSCSCSRAGGRRLCLEERVNAKACAKRGGMSLPLGASLSVAGDGNTSDLRTVRVLSNVVERFFLEY